LHSELDVTGALLRYDNGGLDFGDGAGLLNCGGLPDGRCTGNRLAVGGECDGCHE
jgi:hypothetical protein